MARQLRRDVCDLLEDLGPDAPTLCEGWSARDLAAHLVIRESRPDAAAGILGGPLGRWTEMVQAKAASSPWPELVSRLRQGPPPWSAFRLPGADGLANLVELAVHREDLRRGSGTWSRMALPGDLSDALWGRLRVSGRVLVRRVPARVVVRRTDGAGEVAELRPARGDDRTVVVTGDPLELTLRLFGRHACDVTLTGDAVEAFDSARLSF